MTDLEKLKEELILKTQDLKNEFLLKTEDWAKSDFNRIVKLRDDYYVATSSTNGKNWYWQTQKFLHSKGYSIIQRGLETFIRKEKEKAEMHYYYSIAKLAFRIQEKGLNLQNITVNYAKIGVNINIEITDGMKTVRAFTIVASGDIQRPHYRYLVK